MTKCGRAAAPAAGLLACVIGLPAAPPAQSGGRALYPFASSC